MWLVEALGVIAGVVVGALLVAAALVVILTDDR